MYRVSTLSLIFPWLKPQRLYTLEPTFLHKEINSYTQGRWSFHYHNAQRKRGHKPEWATSTSVREWFSSWRMHPLMVGHMKILQRHGQHPWHWHWPTCNCHQTCPQMLQTAQRNSERSFNKFFFKIETSSILKFIVSFQYYIQLTDWFDFA